jgi:hypothetical protein
MRPINISFDAYGNNCFGLTQNEEAKSINFSKKIQKFWAEKYYFFFLAISKVILASSFGNFCVRWE